jgi:hypothetical protein
MAFIPLVLGMAVGSGARAQEAPPNEEETRPHEDAPPMERLRIEDETLPFNRPGVDVGLRLGFAYPFGKAVGSAAMSDAFQGAFPIVAELGYRINGSITFGALFQYAFTLPKCDPGASCSASVVRLGLEGLYRIPVEGAFVPWLGMGAGYEWLSMAESGNSGSLRGFELLTLQAGADYRINPYLTLGPFVSFSLAVYNSGSDNEASGDVADTSLHEWLQIGLKVTCNFVVITQP